jgi:DNA-binding beta-propeller fold protein YncE
MMEEIGRPLEAISLYNQFIAVAKDDRALAAAAQYQIGVLYHILKRTDQSQRAFKTVISQYPDQPEWVRKAQARIIKTASGKTANETRIKREGPSADGRMLATFTAPSKSWFTSPAFDSARRRFYTVVCRITGLQNEPERKGLGREVRGQSYEPGTLIVIDSDKNSVIKRIPLTVFIGNVVFNPANSKIYGAAVAYGLVRIIDADTFNQSSIRLPGYPSGIAVNPSTNRIYVTCEVDGGNDKLAVIDGATNAVATLIDLKGSSGGPVVNPVTNRIYVPLDKSRTRVFNGADNTALADLPGVQVFAVDTIHDRLYAMAGEDGRYNALQALDANTHSNLATFHIPKIMAAAVNPESSRLYVTAGGSYQLVVIDTATNTEFGRLMGFDNPDRLAVDQKTGRVYIRHRIDTDTGALAVMAKEAAEADQEEFFDQFDRETLDAEWAVLDSIGSYSLKENPGHLRLRVAPPSGSSRSLLLARKFRGDHWTFETKVSYFTGTSGGGRAFKLYISFGQVPLAHDLIPDILIAIGRYRDSWNDCCPGETSWFVREKDKGGAHIILPLNEADTYLWRIKREGRTLTIERSDDGINFSAVGSHTFGPRIDRAIQYLGISFETHANKDAYADYDYVRLSKTMPRPSNY